MEIYEISSQISALPFAIVNNFFYSSRFIPRTYVGQFVRYLHKLRGKR